MRGNRQKGRNRRRQAEQVGDDIDKAADGADRQPDHGKRAHGRADRMLRDLGRERDGQAGQERRRQANLRDPAEQRRCGRRIDPWERDWATATYPASTQIASAVISLANISVLPEKHPFPVAPAQPWPGQSCAKTLRNGEFEDAQPPRRLAGGDPRLAAAPARPRPRSRHAGAHARARADQAGRGARPTRGAGRHGARPGKAGRRRRSSAPAPACSPATTASRRSASRPIRPR